MRTTKITLANENDRIQMEMRYLRCRRHLLRVLRSTLCCTLLSLMCTQDRSCPLTPKEIRLRNYGLLLSLSSILTNQNFINYGTLKASGKEHQK